MQRRTFIITGASALATLKMPTAAGQTGSKHRPSEGTARDTPTAAMVRRLADDLSRQDFVPPAEVMPTGFASIGYDQYRDVRFRPEQAIWHNEHLGFELQFFLSGYIFPSPVEIFLVEDGNVRRLSADPSLFDLGSLARLNTSGSPLSFSGFRIHAPLNRSDYYDEVIAFQGASYFRGLGRNHSYGLSARALALNTSGPEREEFPLFRSFWIERPVDRSSITVHGLLDGPSVTGAYTFVIQPGTATVLDVDALLYPRRDLANVGIAPLTSMFLKDTHDSDGHRDFRPAVHDSDGLAVSNGQNERLWRPLLNVPSKQVSCFRDIDPKGFGLIQRERKFEFYQDLEARYEQRPSAWVTPADGWTAGCVELVELPSQGEYADNIVTYWRPDTPLFAGPPHRLAYRLAWCDDAPVWAGLRVDKTRIGEGSKLRATRFVIDFVRARSQVGRDTPQGANDTTVSSDALIVPLPKAVLTATAGAPTEPLVQPNPHIDGIRVDFELEPPAQGVAELRLALYVSGQLASEVWIYRWMA